MDTKKVLEKLVKIAEDQQKIITKLAQDRLGVAPTSLKPAATQKEPDRVLAANLPPAVKAVVDRVFTGHDAIYVKFNEGHATQANYGAVLRVLKQLTNSGQIQQAWELKLAR